MTSDLVCQQTAKRSNDLRVKLPPDCYSGTGFTHF